MAVEASAQLCTVWRDIVLKQLVKYPDNPVLIARRDEMIKNIQFKRKWLRENPPRESELNMPWEKYSEVTRAAMAADEAQGDYEAARNWASLYEAFYNDVASYPPGWKPSGEYAAWCIKWCLPPYLVSAKKVTSLAAPAKKQWGDAKAKEAAAKAVYLKAKKHLRKKSDAQLSLWAKRGDNLALEAKRAAESQGVSLAVKRWQSAIGRVIKQNRFHKAETKKHEEESERRRRIRETCKEVKAQQEKQWAPSPAVGIAPAVGKCATEKPGTSQLAADHGKKLASLDERKKRLAAKREEQRQKMAEEAQVVEERMRLLDVGFAINKGK